MRSCCAFVAPLHTRAVSMLGGFPKTGTPTAKVSLPVRGCLGMRTHAGHADSFHLCVHDVPVWHSKFCTPARHGRHLSLVTMLAEGAPRGRGGSTRTGSSRGGSARGGAARGGASRGGGAAGGRRVAGDARGGRGGGRGPGSPPPSAKEDRAGLSRREWQLAVAIGGTKKSPSALAQLFALAKKGEFGKLEDIWDREGTSKNEVKRRIKAIRQMQDEGKEAASGAATPEPTLKEQALASELRCIHFGQCSGCTSEAGLATTPITQEATAFFGRLLPPDKQFRVHLGKVHRWRTLAKLAVAPSTGGGVEIGLYQSGSHDVLAIPKCRVHHPSINEAVQVLQREMLDLGVTGYDEFTGIGHVRYVQMMVERHSSRVQLTLVWNADTFRMASPTAQLLVKKLKLYPMFHSIWLNFRTGTGNVIFNRNEQAWHLAHGPPYVMETLLPARSNLTFPIGERKASYTSSLRPHTLVA